MSEFNEVTPLHYWVQKVLPLVYDDSLSYYELLNKVVKKLNDLIKNNAELPKFIQDMIEKYISSGEIEIVIKNVLANYMLNVKFPPDGLEPASGDGTKDDTITIQGCIDYASTHGGMAVYFPSGKYLTQSLNLKNNVSLFGFDMKTTHLVLKGGSINPLVTGACSNNSITGLTLDGNADIQVNNVNLIVLTGGNYNFTDLMLTDGYSLLTLNINGVVNCDNVLFGNGVIDALVTSGNGILNCANLTFERLSTLSGRYCNDNMVDNASFTNIYSTCTVPVAIRNTSNNSVFTGKVINATTTHENNGNNNFYDFYNRGGTIYDKIATDINVEKVARETADTALQTNINTVNTTLQASILNEKTARENADSLLASGIEDLNTKINNREYSVKDFGAVGDGTTIDTQAFKDAITALSTNGGTLYVPNGNYMIDDTLTINNSKSIRIHGCGLSSILNFQNANVDKIVISGTSSLIIIESMWLVAPQVETQGSIIKLTANSNPNLYCNNLTLARGFNGLYIEPGVLSINIFTNMMINDQKGHGVVTKSGGMMVNSNINYSTMSGVLWDDGIGWSMTNVDVFGCGTGVLIRPTAGKNCSYGRFLNVTCESDGSKNNDHGWFIGGGGGTVDTLVMTNCWGGNNGKDGMRIDSGVSFLDLIGFQGCSNILSGIEIIGSADVTVNGGLFAGNTVDGITVYPNTSNFRILNTRIGNSGGFTGNGRYGIQIFAGTSDYYIVANNDCHGNTSINLQDGGTGTHKVVANNLT